MILWSFRPLAVFWAVTLGMLASGALGLEIAGPPPLTVRFPAPRAVKVVEDSAAPARMPPSTLHPAPALALTSTSIPDPDPALLEPAPTDPDRMMPRRQGDRASWSLYAAAFDPAERHPRVALVLDGAGLDEATTRQAIASLPHEIDLGFSAYTPPSRAATLAGEARRQGRECLASIPMEPSGYPAAEEGSRALQTGAPEAQNRRNLEWSLSAVQGCVGATGASDGLAGERYAESRTAFTDLLGELDRRGLIYLDPRPGAPAPDDVGAPTRRAPYQADLVIGLASSGEPDDAAAIDRRLAALTDAALHHGSAVGVAGPPTPVLLDRLAVWAHGLAARGVVLAPLSALPPPPHGTAG